MASLPWEGDVPFNLSGDIRHLQESVQSKSVKLLLRLSRHHFSPSGCTGRPAALALFIFAFFFFLIHFWKLQKIDLLQKAGR